MSVQIKTAMRVALCKRLRETLVQETDRGQIACNGDTVQCGTCDRTIEAIEEARKAETRAEIGRQFETMEGSENG